MRPRSGARYDTTFLNSGASGKITVFLLATAGVVIATALFGVGIYFAFGLTGVNMPLSWSLVLGAIVAPTDPVAVGAVL
jgi:CPA1 family monovalent cation:H+ antiporter